MNVIKNINYQNIFLNFFPMMFRTLFWHILYKPLYHGYNTDMYYMFLRG